MVGARSNLRFTVSASTVRNILKRYGIDPVPERGKRTTWGTFLKTHWELLAATDFFTVEVWPDVEAIGLVESLHSALLQRSFDLDPGVVVQDVDAAVGRAGVGDQEVQSIVVGGVRRSGLGAH